MAADVVVAELDALEALMADHAAQEVEAIGEAGAERAISAAVVAGVVYGLGLEDLAVAEAEVLGLALMLLTLLPKRTHAALQGWSSPHTDGTGMTLSHTGGTAAMAGERTELQWAVVVVW